MGKAGAGVPKPSIAKRTNESSSAGMASAMRIMPIGRLAGTATRGGCSCQPEINQGTSPATTPRAMTKKTADPKTAGNFLISDQSNLCLSGTWSSCSASSPSATPERLFFICSEFRARMFQKGATRVISQAAHSWMRMNGATSVPEGNDFGTTTRDGTSSERGQFDRQLTDNPVSSKPHARRTLRVPTIAHFLMLKTFIPGA